MLKERMVTRTIISYEVKVKAINLDNYEVHDELCVFDMNSCLDEHPEKAEKLCDKQLTSCGKKCIKVESIRKKEILYGMSEVDFIKNARILPPRGTKEE